MTPAELRAIRAGLGLSQAKLADLLGIGLSTLCGWEQGRRAIPGLGVKVLRMLRQDAGLVERLREVGNPG